MKSVAVLGIRGVPASYGGFETFAEHLGLFLVGKGWKVVIYCQEDGPGIRADEWRGIQRILIPGVKLGPLSSVVFDLRCTWHCYRSGIGTWLVLGYGTGFLALFTRLVGRRQITNMDGFEWRRAKWSGLAKAWLWLNEKFAGWFSRSLIADHPIVAEYLVANYGSGKVTMIPYGADEPGIDAATSPLGLRADDYFLVIARPEPENSIFEIVSAFSKKPRGCKLVVLGAFIPGVLYHDNVVKIASEEVVFPGAIYDKAIVQALRRNCIAYVHGHTVGGTNPSLVEALGAGCAIIAHENGFNSWVAGSGALFFKDEASLDSAFARLADCGTIQRELKEAAGMRFNAAFRWGPVLSSYESLLAEDQQ